MPDDAQRLQDDARRLHHILGCAQEVEEYLEGRDLEGFLEDRMRQRAVERLLTIIGEAARQLGEETKAAIPQPWRELIRFRDKGIHGYDSLSAQTLFGIATQSVPDLEKAIRHHLAKTET